MIFVPMAIALFSVISKEPFRTKNTTESEFGTGSKIRYREKKTLQRLLRNACFTKRRNRKTVRIIKNYGRSKYYGFQRRSIFSTEGSFGLGYFLAKKGLGKTTPHNYWRRAVSESTVSNTELSEFFGPHRAPGRELGELLSAYYLWAKANSPSVSQNSPSLVQNSVRLSEFFSLKQYSRNNIPPVSQTKVRGWILYTPTPPPLEIPF